MFRSAQALVSALRRCGVNYHRDLLVTRGGHSEYAERMAVDNNHLRYLGNRCRHISTQVWLKMIPIEGSRKSPQDFALAT